MINPYKNIYPHIAEIPREAWKKKAWPITEQEVLKPKLDGPQGKLFEKKRQTAKEKMPYADD